MKSCNTETCNLKFPTDIDECKTQTDDCDDNAGCTNTIGSYTCDCNNGYAGDGKSCNGKFFTSYYIKYTCMIHSHRKKVTIKIQIGNFSFDCFYYVPNFYFATDIDECTLGTDNCDVNANCTNTIGSFECFCNDGFEGDGTSCSGKDKVDTHLF